LKTRETKKLFYNEYPYKLGFSNPLAHIFREKNFKFARDQLHKLQMLYNENEPLTLGSYRQKTYTEQSFKECKWLYEELQSRDDYKIRIEFPFVQLYSSDKDWLYFLSKKIENPLDFYEPPVMLSKNTILVETPSNYGYRITLNSKPDPSLASWIQANPKLAKAGPVFLDEVANSGYSKGLYFYVRDDKVLNIVGLMLGSACRVDKIVCKQDLDK
jgi:hypothetical protein